MGKDVFYVAGAAASIAFKPFLEAKSPSKTTPDMSLTLKELVTRHSRGIPVPTFKPVYSDDPLLPDLNRLTPMDVQDLSRQISDYIAESQLSKEPETEPTEDSEQSDEQSDEQ